MCGFSNFESARQSKILLNEPRPHQYGILGQNSEVFYVTSTCMYIHVCFPFSYY